MSPALDMATSLTSIPSGDSNQYYNSKYGRIAIFTGDNYAAFAATCRTALVVVGAWDITQGTELRPAGQSAAARDWEDRNRKAIQLISSATSAPLQSRIADAIIAKDVPAIWAELARDDKSRNAVHLNTLNTDFQSATWDPQTESIRTFVNRLEDYRSQLHGTSRAISEDTLRWKVIMAIPKTGNWPQAKQFCLEGDKSLQESIVTIQSYETLKADLRHLL